MLSFIQNNVWPNKNLKCLVFGAGNAAKNHVEKFTSLRHCDVTIFNPSGNSGALNFKTVRRYDALKANHFDFAVIASTTHAHYDNLMFCLEHQIPALAEKPVVSEAHQISSLKKHSPTAGHSILIAQNLRYQPNTIKLLQTVKNTPLTPKVIFIRWFRPLQLNGQNKDSSQIAKELLLDWGIHALDLAVALVPVQSINIIESDIGWFDQNNGMLLRLYLKSKNNTEIQIEVSKNAPRASNHPLSVTVEFENDSKLLWTKSGGITAQVNGVKTQLATPRTQSMHEIFLSRYLNKRGCLQTFDDNLAALNLGLHALGSACKR